MKTALILFLILAACGPRFTEPKVGTAEWVTTLSPEDRAAFYARSCEQKGFRLGMEDFNNCVYDLSNAYELSLVRREFWVKVVE